MSVKRSSILFLLLFFSVTLSAQRVKKVCGEYTYTAPENISLEEAKQIALERAKIQALADEFGTLISQQNLTDVKNRNTESKVNFLSLSSSDVKGEWVEDVQQPVFHVVYDQGMLVVKVSVCGKAREITHAEIDFSAKILCNGTEAKYESSSFKNGDDLFLLFQTPVSGYLTVYLVDESQTAYCLLPYMADSKGEVEVTNNKEFLFFSTKGVEKSEANKVDEYTMTCDKELEHNRIYVIFSPNKFTKANDSKQEGSNLPRKLSYLDFQKWLIKNRTKDKDMCVKINIIEIKRQ